MTSQVGSDEERRVILEYGAVSDDETVFCSILRVTNRNHLPPLGDHHQSPNPITKEKRVY